eukprot:CAMPEP_0115736258 /NCGR_PEP_ID=MMETSP0272-20121206/87159_1 /TAXON_ID=71861 /ORGANISM="Scrippsiella trochoidea, Strain CCMP3099" /LENGTH=65 /DNA_ID=CAMNT_0003180423 /DNA_START=48 /DNA_END=242 /DNA_ORIENTATION=-
MVVTKPLRHLALHARSALGSESIPISQESNATRSPIASLSASGSLPPSGSVLVTSSPDMSDALDN